MKLPGWKSLGGTDARYINPQGEEVSRREYLNAQARSIGYHSYSQYQGESKKTMYREIVSRAADPREARKLDSAFNSTWAKNIKPKLEAKKPVSRHQWQMAYDAADVDADDEIWTWYHG